MKPKFTAVLALALSFAATAFAQYSLTAEDAKTAADKIYKKGATLAETVAKTRPEYAKWRKGQLEELSKKVEFGKWYVSIALRWNVATKYAVLDKFDPNANFENAKFWATPEIADGQPFDLQPYNWRFFSATYTYLHREITAKEDCKIAVSVSALPLVEMRLNGKTLLKTVDDPKDKKWAGQNVKKGNKWCSNGTTDIVVLDLKKGTNVIDFAFFAGETKGEKDIMFSPYADASFALTDKLLKDFYPTANSLRRWKISSSTQTLPALFSAQDNSEFMADILENLVESSMFSAGKLEEKVKAISGKKGEQAFNERVALFENGLKIRKAERKLGYDIDNVRAAMEDIAKSYPDYDKKLFDELKTWQSQWKQLKEGVLNGDAQAEAKAEEFKAFAKRALLANPLLKKYPHWVFVRRDDGTKKAGLPANWQGNTSLTNAYSRDKDGNYTRVVRPHDFKDQLWSFDIASPADSLKCVFKPAKDTAVADLDISYDGKRVLFSTLDDKSQWHIDELDVASGKTKQITPRLFPDIDDYDGCYLPDGQIIYCSSATFVGVPCVAGTDYVPNLFKLNPNAGTPEQVDKTIRQLTFEQDADWMPIVAENGRVLYTRWEYTDNSHYFARILMHMNPDGTAQSSFYGTTSFWPNSLFYCRPIPNDPNKFVGIVSGHHGISRTGELHSFDVSKGNIEERGRVHKFPSYGRTYEPRILDQLVNGKWPQLIHPYPLSEKYIVCAGKESPENFFTEYGGRFTIYLIDAFDNMVPLVELKDAQAMEPMPLQPRKVPQEIMDKTNPEIDYGYVFLNDIYQGEGLKGVPRGTVKELRIIEYFYGYRNVGNHHVIAEEGSWDIKRIHGTVKVEEDGSAFFKAPANRPIAVQPLDKDGNALQLMRSWFTIMPGETQSCVGCHESQGMSPTSKPAMAGRKRPQEIKKFVGDVRGYSYKRDIQPIVDKYCLGCHSGAANRPDFRRGESVFWTDGRSTGFGKSYLDMMPYVRRPGPESNQHMLPPLEFHTSTSELIQMLEKGHKGVKLDDQSMRMLRTWIDLNVPFHGTWTETYKKIPWDDHKRRAWALAKYANRHDDQNAITYDGGVQKFVAPAAPKTHAGKKAPKVDGFPFDASTAAKMRDDTKLPKELVADLGGGVQMRFTLIPAGKFVMGTNSKFYDEGPAQVAEVSKPFYMAQLETTNRQYKAFDANYDSGHLDRHWKDHVNPGYPVNKPEQPVIRVSWNNAEQFCKWMSEKLGVKVSLPTEKQWEWAARGGSDKDFWFGKVGDNYGAYDNLADYNTRHFAVDGIDPQPVVNPNPYIDYVPKDLDVDDNELIMCEVGKYKPNPFGLYDINGNVAEWTADDYTETLGGAKVADRKTVRGGSWRDRAKWARVSVRRNYAPWQGVYNVGFRVVIDDAQKAAQLLKPAKPLPQAKEHETTPRPDSLAKVK